MPTESKSKNLTINAQPDDTQPDPDGFLTELNFGN